MHRCCLEARRGRGGDHAARSLQGRAEADRRTAAVLLCRPIESRYMVPEQRVLRIARIGPEQVAGVTASDQEIAAYYNANKSTYAPTETRSLTPGRGPGPGDRQCHRPARQGRSNLAAAAAPAGTNAAVSTLKDQSRDAYAGVAGQRPRRRCSAPPSERVVGPVKIRLRLGRREGRFRQSRSAARRSTRREPKSPPSSTPTSARARSRTLSTRSRTRVDGGSNFGEAVGAAKLPVTTTPLITVQRHLARGPVLQAAARTRARAEGRLRDRAERSARARHPSRRRGLCAGFAGPGRARLPRSAGLHP